MKKQNISHYLSPLGAWALAFGSAVGWGSFVMPGNTFLPLAGPMGSVLGLGLGALVMLLIGANYAYMMRSCPDAGGAFTYTKKCFGYDHGFLSAWFLVLTYVAIIWANATALPLIARNLIGGVFQVGGHYRLAGFEIYTGEVLLSMAALGLCALICCRNRLAQSVQIVMALVLLIGVSVCFVSVFTKHQGGFASMEPAFSPDHSKIGGVFNIVALAPWAYIGFESISHSAGEFNFPVKRSLGIMTLSLVAGAAAYGMLALVAVGILPQGFSTWTEYLKNLGSLSGLEGIPTFYSGVTALGALGRPLLILAALGGIFTGLIGNSVAASRLVSTMAEDELLPEWFGERNRNGAPANALLAIMGVSLLIPLLGRTATSWIVDVTTVGAVVAYAYTSACAYHTAKREGNRLYVVLGGTGLAISLIFALYFLVPNMLAITALGAESYLILAAWSILGFAYFHFLLRHDKRMRMGRSTVVWLILLLLIYMTSLIWMRQSIDNVSDRSAEQMVESCETFLTEAGVENVEEELPRARQTINELFAGIDSTMKLNSFIQMALVLTSLGFLLNINMLIQKRERETEKLKILAEESSRAKTSFLSNMSHEIRTPMNAIIGLDNIALRDPDLAPHTREQLEKIGASARHLLGLINDILDMSRIESGRMVLKQEEFSLRDVLDQVNVIINGQCSDKGLSYECQVIGHVDDYYVGDDMKLKQVLINILGNSVKFTDPGGAVTLSVEPTASFEGYRTLRFTMKDTGIGMDKEYLPKIFEAFSQEDATSINKYGGSGLGMAITKSFVEMMNGEIGVDSEKGVGTTFTVTVTLTASDRSDALKQTVELPKDLRVLIVDDDEVACEHEALIFSAIGIKPTVAHSGGEALGRLRSMHELGQPYQLLLSDYKMPGMDGLELTRTLRSFDGGETEVIILTGYNWDDIQKDAEALGVAGIMSKPIFTETLLGEIHAILDRRASGEERADGAGEAEMENVLEGRRVLIAEDVPINAEILIDLLDMEGIEAEHAENGQIAVEMFDRSPIHYYDAVLMDVRMPVMDGLSATRAIRELNRQDARTVPIIAMTANAFDEDVRRSLQAGMDAHLSKPVDSDKLYQTLRRLLPLAGPRA